MQQSPLYSVTDFVGICNQVLEVSFGVATIYGELANFRVSKNKWVYFDLKDEFSKLKFFASIYVLPGPLEDGMNLEVVGRPNLHPQFGFSVQVQAIRPTGEGSIKKAASLLEQKLEKEGLFAEDRKRPIPHIPHRIGLVASTESAAYGDFMKIVESRWPDVEVVVANSNVQGVNAVEQLVKAIHTLNKVSSIPDVIVMIRGGGAADELDAFNAEPVVRAVAASRAPTIVAIGHERDVALAERAADLRASTPSNAAEMVLPDRSSAIEQLSHTRQQLSRSLLLHLDRTQQSLVDMQKKIGLLASHSLAKESTHLQNLYERLTLLHPKHLQKKGYVLVRNQSGNIIKKSSALVGLATIEFYDGSVMVERKE